MVLKLTRSVPYWEITIDDLLLMFSVTALQNGIVSGKPYDTVTCTWLPGVLHGGVPQAVHVVFPSESVPAANQVVLVVS